MPINPSLLIAAPMLQDAILDDATGLPLIAGVITLYQDNSRTTFKNWYYQTGAPGAYTYVPLANPLVLNGAGVITDPNGNDTIPFFYPFSEVDNVTPQPYYITVQDSSGHSKITRQNFPFNPTTSIVNTVNATLQNYIVNNVFWRNNGVFNLTSMTSTVLAPSIHQGFVNNINVAASPPLLSSPDITFFKSTTGSNDTITFSKFTAGTFLSSANPANLDVTPEYFLNFTCGAAGSETFKYVQFPLSLHLKTLDNVPATITFWARCNSGSNVLVLNIYQYGGTGGGAPVTTTIKNGAASSIILPVDATWHKYTLPFTMPPAANVSPGGGGDDAVFLQFSYPAGGTNTFNIDIAKPCFYVGNQSPTNDMQLYDPEEAIFNSARTGDTRTSLNTFQPYGWVPMNDGVISNAGTFTAPTNIPVSRTAQDTWPLFNLLWQLAQPHDTGGGGHFNPVCQMFDSSGNKSDYGASAIADFTTNTRQMQIPMALGRALIGAPVALTASYNHATIPAWNQANYGSTAVAGLFTLTGTVKNTYLYPGAPVYLTGTLPPGGSFTANVVYYAIPDPTNNLNNGNTFQLATTYANAILVSAIGATGLNDSTSVTVNFALADSFGQGTHQQTPAELVIHSHTYTNTAAGGAIFAGGAGNQTQTSNTGNTGNSQYFNLVQPVTYMNIFMKL